MGTSSSHVSNIYYPLCAVAMAMFSLGYEGEVPGEVRALVINPVMPQQVCVKY